ncbi:hypothetical protein QUA20_28420 [Microcoleus sp. Pol7_A1]|uniref:hypothetical protein n=1 Tax=Microcoleus sp. Pol7_A1 TaxID=2818893 RepID=UPI002FD52769
MLYSPDLYLAPGGAERTDWGASQWEHLTFAPKLEIGVLRQEAEGKRKKEGARRTVFTNMRCSNPNSIKSVF